MKSKVEHLDHEISIDSHNEKASKERQFVRDVCMKHERFDDSHGHGHEEDLQLSGEQLHEYMNDLAEPCHDMLLRCHFEGRDYNCSDLFIPVITDEGQCCSMNIMPEPVMFENSQVEVNRHLRL